MAKILFRTSGGRTRKKQLGLGHIFRCIHLSSYLNSHELEFLIEDYGSVYSTLSEYGFKKISKLPLNISEFEDFKKTSNYIVKHDIDLLIVDKYGFTNNYISKLKKMVKVVVISDLKNISFDADLLINGFIGYENKIAYNRFKTKCLLGPKYQILSKDYETITSSEKKYDLLITLGGFDARNMLELFLKKISKLEKQLKIKLILGPATNKSLKIKNFKKSHHNIDIVRKTKYMKKEISSSKFGICGGGITSYEFAALNVPFAIVCQYPHQIITAKEWNKKKIAKNLGFVEPNTKKIDIFLNNVVNGKIDLKRNNVVDGLGTKRVAKQILKIVKN